MQHPIRTPKHLANKMKSKGLVHVYGDTTKSVRSSAEMRTTSRAMVSLRPIFTRYLSLMRMPGDILLISRTSSSMVSKAAVRSSVSTDVNI